MVPRSRGLRVAASIANAVTLPVARALTSLVVVRMAGLETWGSFVGALLAVQLAASIIDWGSRDALVRSFSRAPSSMEATWRSATVTRALFLPIAPLAFLVLGFAPIDVAWMTIWLAGLFVTRMHDALVAQRRAFGFAISTEVGATAGMVAAVLVLGQGTSVGWLIALFAVGAVARAVACLVRFRMLRPSAWRGRVDLGSLRQGWPFFALSFSGALGSRVDLYVVALLLTASDLGRYQVLTGLLLVVQSLSAAVLAPSVPALYRLSRSAVNAISVRLAGVGLALTLAGLAGMWAALRFLYQFELPATVLVLAWLATLPPWLYLVHVHLAFRAGRERLVVGANLTAIAVVVLGTLLLVPSVGLAGAVAAAALGQVSVAAVVLIGVRRFQPNEALNRRIPSEA